MASPLADLIRPQSLDEVVGQRHLVSEGCVLRKLIDGGNIPNLIFYGPSGTGKTTIANIIAKSTGKPLYKLNATTASVSDIRAVVSELDGLEASDGAILYLDEIQNFNKKQQQSLLEFIETGKLTLIASTTENPYFYIYNAILSRSNVFEFRPVEPEEIEKAIERAVKLLSKQMGGVTIWVSPDAIRHLANCAGGDVRKALNSVEMLVMSATPDVSGNIKAGAKEALAVTQKKVLRHDRDGDSHYDVLSAFHKSIRGSDVNAGLHYLARMLSAGDIISPSRRLLAIASEDVGMAYPQAVSIVKSCVDSAMQLGLPEAKLPLAQAVIVLATAPKSNSVVMAIDAAMADIEKKDTGTVPANLQDAHYGGAAKLGHGVGYMYPHSYPNHYVEQQYLPDALEGAVYYEPQDNKNENALAAYWNKIKGE